jgi:hypothetical protein
MDAINTKTGRVEATETSYENQPPFGTPQWNRLIVRVDDFMDEESGDLMSSIVDETDPDNPILVKKRRHQVDWRNDLGLTAGDVTDALSRVKLEHRDDEQARASIVRVKS